MQPGFRGPQAIDGIVGVNTSITDPPQPNNGSNYSLVSVVEHEIDEILGSGSAIPNCNDCGTARCGQSFARRSLSLPNANGTRSSLTVNCANPGTTRVLLLFRHHGPHPPQFNNACNGGDFERLGEQWYPAGAGRIRKLPGAKPRLRS